MSKNSILMLTLAVFMFACGGGGSDKKVELEKLKKEKAALDSKISTLEEEIALTDTTKTEKLTDVVVMPLIPVTFKSYIEVQGRIDAEESVSISTEMPGTITKINVKIGERVSKGQVLAETDSRATQQQLAILQTSLNLITQTYERQKSLWEQKIGTEMQLLQIKTGKEAMESQIAATQEQLRMSKIISPIDGTVDGIEIKLGQLVSPGMNAMTVINFSNLKVKAEVAEAYTARVKNGNEVLVLFPDMNDSITSTVHYASRAIKPLTRTFGVEVLLNGKKEFHPNTVAKLKINDYQSAKPEIVVPVKYIQKTSDASFVMVSEKGTVVQKTVTIGREYNGMAEILTGLKEGDLMITLGYDLVNDGTKINVKKL